MYTLTLTIFVIRHVQTLTSAEMLQIYVLNAILFVQSVMTNKIIHVQLVQQFLMLFTTYSLEQTHVLMYVQMDNIKMLQLTNVFLVILIVLHVMEKQITVQLAF